MRTTYHGDVWTMLSLLYNTVSVDTGWHTGETHPKTVSSQLCEMTLVRLISREGMMNSSQPSSQNSSSSVVAKGEKNKSLNTNVFLKIEL